MSEEEQEHEVVIEKGKQCSIEHTRSRSRQKQVEEKGGKKNFTKGRETRARSASEEVVLHEMSHTEISANKKISRKQERGEGEGDGYNIKTINSLKNNKT